jgi:hypothetical protein
MDRTREKRAAIAAQLSTNQLLHARCRDATLSCDHAQNTLPHNIVKPVEDMALAM